MVLGLVRSVLSTGQPPLFMIAMMTPALSAQEMAGKA
jgi:hypothetical protein